MSSCLIFTCRRGSLREAIAAVSIKCGPAFTRIVVGDRKDVNTADEKVMPSFGADRNVMCYFDDIYVLSASPLGRQAGWRSTGKAPGQTRSSCESADGLYGILVQLIAWAMRNLGYHSASWGAPYVTFVENRIRQKPPAIAAVVTSKCWASVYAQPLRDIRDQAPYRSIFHVGLGRLSRRAPSPVDATRVEAEACKFGIAGRYSEKLKPSCNRVAGPANR